MSINSRWKLTRDPSGRVRVGGRFVSARQLGSVVGARTRRGQTTPTALRTLRVAPTRAAQSARKSALTRQLTAAGGEFVGQTRTTEQRFLQREYSLSAASPELASLIIQRELLGRTGDVLVTAFATGTDNEGNPVSFGTFSVNARSASAAEDMIGDLLALMSEYQIAEVDTIGITFSFSAEAEEA